MAYLRKKLLVGLFTLMMISSGYAEASELLKRWEQDAHMGLRTPILLCDDLHFHITCGFMFGLNKMQVARLQSIAILVPDDELIAHLLEMSKLEAERYIIRQ